MCEEEQGNIGGQVVCRWIFFFFVYRFYCFFFGSIVSFMGQLRRVIELFNQNICLYFGYFCNEKGFKMERDLWMGTTLNWFRLCVLNGKRGRLIAQNSFKRRNFNICRT